LGSSKKEQRGRLEENRKNGERAEKEAKLRWNLDGYTMERSSTGEDFIARKKEYLLFGKIVETKHVEVKYGDSPLSEEQEKLKKRKSNYVVDRYTEDNLWFH